MTSTSGITSKSPTIIVPPITISLRCLDSQNLRRSCSIMTVLLFATTGSVCQRELERKVGGWARGTLADAGAFQSDFSDVWHLLQIANEAVDALIRIASTCQRRGLPIANTHPIEPDIIRHALANMAKDLLPVLLR